MRGNTSPRRVSLLTDYDAHLFKDGNHFCLYEKLGSHTMTVDGVSGTYFAVWAPNALKVSVIGDFNAWRNDSDPMQVREDGSGIWESFIPEARTGALYKYHITSRYNQYEVDKGDPYAFRWETPPQTASIVCDLEYRWGDQEWMANRARANGLDAPLAVYEVHLGSWRRVPEKGNRLLTYRELADVLVPYLLEMGFTHVELMPITEHPFYGSWGYQTIGYFAPTGRHGRPEDLMVLIDTLHQQGIGVILDWVPAHFPSDEHGLAYFDGTHLFEHADPHLGFHPDWNTCIFNYSRNEVKSFLISSACFWLEKYHIDGLRVDAVASMLYLDYGRQEGEWIPNKDGGRENIEAISMLKQLNTTLYQRFPDTQTFAEESTAWPMVSRPVHIGGLGFGMKWNMGWMHDTLDYWSKDPIHRKHHHDRITFSLSYAFHENFLLPLSHDEVVYGKRSLLGKMPGDKWQQFANLRLLFGYMYAYPGKKLLFMGSEWGQGREWNHEESLDWHLLELSSHHRLQRWVRDLNRFYRNEPAMYEADFESPGFEWIDYRDREQGVLSFIRRGRTTDTLILVVCNTTPVTRHHYRVGVPSGGLWSEVLNSDAGIYGGSGTGNVESVEASRTPAHQRRSSLSLSLPPLGVLFLKYQGSPTHA
ncbi:MAG: 1,4-alpha-glucan branching protein GlgB [Nitrospiria bacterium]